MTFPKKTIPFVMMVGVVNLGGCEAPQGGRYNNAVYDAPSYDSSVYTPKMSPDFYDSSHYHGDSYLAR